MMHTLLYSEMNQAVPGATLGSGHDGAGGYGECRVPSPSQWSDPCYSPPSFHSPQHLPVELEKVKEEPFSPPSSVASYLTLSPSPPTPPHHLSSSSPSSTAVNPPPPHHGSSPYGRPSSTTGHVIKKDGYESCINLAELLNDNQSLMQLHHHQAPSPPSSYGAPSPPSSYGAPSPPSSYGAPSPPSSAYGGVGGYPDHPLLRGRLEETNAFQQKMGIAPGGGGRGSPSSSSSSFESHHQLHSLNDHISSSSASFRSSSSSSSSSNDGLSFLESLVDVKQEAEDDVSVGSSCGSPAVPSPGGAGGQLGGSGGGEVVMAPVSCQKDILETVEKLAQEHIRRDVQSVSDSLNIPLDPAQWTVEDVRAWLELQASQLNLPPLKLDFWNYGGPSLLKLTEQQFRQLAPIGGELLYAKLEIWRQALRSSPKFSLSSPPSSSHHHHTYTFLQHHQLTGGVPPPPPPAAAPLSPSQDHHHHHHHLMMVVSPHHQHALHLQHLQQQQQQQQVVHPLGGTSPPSSTLGGGGAPASPPLPLVPSMAQVPASVAQVNQQQAAATAPASPSPQQQQQQQGSTATAVYLEDPCLDMAALLQQQQQPSANSPKGTSSPSSSSSSSSSSSHSTHGSPAATLCSQNDEAYESEEEVEEETCTTGGGGGSGRGGTHIHLWQFLKELLQQPQLYGSCIRWLDRQKGVFKIEDSVRVARLWGKRKNRPAMNYDKLSRSIRQYYKKGIMKKTERSQRLVYQFCHPYCL